ncbi:Melanization protease 1 [Amphibalanus amphitrite]|uniref:CLIP domain-containing serine protease n=1 Tax=Amphibalanus amphitrite TaxID=1232801 RepID=A0A6A4VRC9_AMPAM|nr:Melanization protease 1 [Amphibalanus amphitrite]
MLLTALLSVLLVTGGLAGRPRRQLGTFCRDFAGRPGTCGAPQQCPALLRLLAAGAPSAAEVSGIRRSVCGRLGRQLLFCCASGPVPQPVTPAPQPVTPAPRPVTPVPPEQHPNRAILNRGFVCGTSPAGRIVGGQETEVGEYPWVALLGYQSLDNRRAPVSFECGGTLISLQHVLTAAHCVDELPIRDARLALTTVRLGEHNLDTATECRQLRDGSELCNRPQDFRIARVQMHADYDRGSSANDIALITLDRPVVEDTFIGKICLPFGEAGRRNYTGAPLRTAGFGRTGPSRQSPSSPVLLDVLLPGVEQSQCAATIRQNGGTVTPLQICAGGVPGEDSCQGDSGGPLMAPSPSGPPFSLVGVVSFGAVRCGEGGVPSVNTRVSEYLNWILDRLDN